MVSGMLKGMSLLDKLPEKFKKPVLAGAVGLAGFGLLAMAPQATTPHAQSHQPEAVAMQAMGEPSVQKKHGVKKVQVFYRIRINTAGLADWDQLPGIGPVMAKRILAERQRRGGSFASIDALLEVKGIGPKKLAKMRPYLSL